jgi:sigma-E factor negative regulatory protein RseC
MGEGNERILDITDYTPDLQIGDTVSITISRKMGNRAVLLGYLVPFLILITALLILNHFGIREWLSGLIAISLLIPYFFIIYLLRDILRKKFSISARK